MLDLGALAVAVLGDGQKLLPGVLGDDHAGHDLVALAQGQALDARGRAAHGPDLGTGEADGVAVGRDQDHLVVGLHLAHADELVVLAHAQGNETHSPDIAVEAGRAAFDHALAGVEEVVLFLIQVTAGHGRGDVLVAVQGQQVGHVLAARRAPALGDLVHLDLVHLPLVAEQVHVLVVGGGQDGGDEVLVGHLHAGDARAAAALLAVVVQARALQVPVAGQGDDHGLVGDDVLDVDGVGVVGQDLGLARRGECVAQLLELLPDDGLEDLGVLDDAGQVLDLLEQLGVFLQELLALEVGQALQAHVEDGLGLDLGQPEALAQALLGLLRRAGGTDEADHLVDVVQGDAQAFEDMGPVLGLLQVEARTPDDDLAAVIEEILEHLLEVQELRPVVDHGHHVDAETRLQGRVLEELIDDDVGEHALLQVHDDADALHVRLVAQVRDALDLALVDEQGDLLHQGGLVQGVGDLPDHDGFEVPFSLLDLDAGADAHGAAARVVGLADAGPAVEQGGRGEVRGLDVAHEFVDGGLRVVQQVQGAVHHLAQVVGRDVGGHAHGDARGAVDEQVGHLGRQDRGLLQGVVVVGAELHRVLLDVGQEGAGQPRHARFGVTHGRRGVAVDGAEVALPVDQGVAHVEVLGHAHQGVVHGQVAVGMEFADDVTDHAGGLLVGPVVRVAQLVHGEEDSPVHGLEAVAHVRDGPADDDAQRIFQVGFLQFFLDADVRHIHLSSL